MSADAARRNADSAAVFVVTGASGGLGGEICANLVARTAGTVVACCRDPSRISDPRLVGNSRVRVVDLDVGDDASVAALAEKVGDRVDVCVNVAGVLHSGSQRPERALADVDPAWMRTSYQVNAMGALLVTQALAPALRANDRPKSIVASLSARVGSISDNRLGGWYSYRMSKAALNMATKTMALELKRQGTIVVALHPGTVDTPLSEPFQRNVDPKRLFTRDFSASSLLTIIDGLEQTHTGGFFAWDGEPIPF